MALTGKERRCGNMGIRFNADEVFEMAERIEENGAAFYQAAAECVEPALRQLMTEFAEWERDHKHRFAAMREELSARSRDSTAFDPDGDAALYLQALASGEVFDVKADPLAELGELPTSAAILEYALGREKDSIVFYVGMRDMVPVRLGRDRVDAIIREEMSHVATLNERLEGLRA